MVRVSNRDTFFPTGEHHAWDCEMVTIRTIPLTPGAIGVGLATIRPDGFVSLHAGEMEGDIVTCPMFLKGARLFVNTNAFRGSLRVAILDKSGKPIEPYSRSECDTLDVDSFSHAVLWNGYARLDELRGREIRLQFHLRNTHLYSFWTE